MPELLRFILELLKKYNVNKEERHQIEALFMKFVYDQIDLAVFINSWMLIIASVMNGNEIDRFAVYKLDQLTRQHEISKN